MTKQRYDNNFDKSKQNVCLALIKDARDKRLMRPLAAYYLLKEQYKNSTLYDYKGRMPELANGIGICARTLHTYINAMRRLGLVYDHKNNLTLRGTRKVKNAHKERKKYQIVKSQTIDDIEASLFGILIEERGRQIDHTTSIVGFAKELKKRAPGNDAYIMQRAESYPTPPAFSYSIRSTAKLLSVSKPKATKILKKLNEQGVFQTIDNPARCLGRGNGQSKKHFSEDRAGYFFLHKGFLFRQFGRKHIFIMNPPKQKELTFKRFYSILKQANPELKAQVYAILDNDLTI